MTRSLVEQFYLEATDLLAAVSTSLLALEDGSDDEALTRLFRNLHTVKGASAIFPIPSLTATVHSMESVVAALRAAELAVSPDLIDDLLAGTDSLQRWVAIFGSTGALEIPAAEVDALRLRLHRWTGQPDGVETRPDAVPLEEAQSWLALLPAEHLRQSRDWLLRTGAHLRALRYTPARDALFRGEDPVSLLLSVPGLELAGVGLESSSSRDSFDCALVLVALTRAEPAEIQMALADASGTLRVCELDAAGLVAGSANDPHGLARQVIQAQISLLNRLVPEAQRESSWRAAARSAAAGVRSLDSRPEAATELAAALAAAVDDGAADALTRHLAGVLARSEQGTHAPERPAGPTAVAPTAEPEHSDAKVTDRGLRVDRATVDQLLRTGAELVVATNALPFLARQAEDEGHPALAHELIVRAAATRRMVSDLQALVLDMRMLPLGLAFERFPRMVRDTARTTGKSIRLELEGADLHADADIIDALGDVLVHLVRNAVDHGIESPDVRRAAGKAPEGVVLMRAVEEPDGLLLEVSDDGRGMDLVGLRREATLAGLLERDEAASLTTADVAELAFLPGVSTADAVTDLSGRGVGLDAVRDALCKVHGTVTMASIPGVGTTVSIHLPRSLTITDALVVRSGSQRFAIPIEQVRETTRLPLGGRRRLGRSGVVELHGSPVPLHDLGQLLRVAPNSDQQGQVADAGVLILVAETAGGPVALEIDAIEGREEVLVQPLHDLLGGHAAVLGTALRGDGSVLLVLDAGEVCRAS